MMKVQLHLSTGQSVHKKSAINIDDLLHEVSKINKFLHLCSSSENKKIKDKELSQLWMEILKHFNSLEEKRIDVFN